MPGKVKVKIISGRNLPVMDRSSDTTDAYVEIKLGTTTYKTDVCRKSLHPKWNSEWYRFELDDAELQDEPLQIRLMDHDTYSANDAIGKVYLNLNPLLLPASGLLRYEWNGEVSRNRDMNAVMSGWIPVYDTMHGIRGEVNLTVKVELFSDSNKFRQSSCGVLFFYSKTVPHGYYAQTIHGFVEELIVSDDPEYQWIDKIRTPRASNEARQTLFFKLSGELQRKIGLKALEMGGNAVIAYTQCFDLEGESGIVARGIGTAVTLVKLMEPLLVPTEPNSLSEERTLKYLEFLGYKKSFRLNILPKNLSLFPQLEKFRECNFNEFDAAFKRAQFRRQISYTEFNNPSYSDSYLPTIQHSSSLQTLLRQEDMRGSAASGLSQRIRNLKYPSMFSKKNTRKIKQAKSEGGLAPARSITELVDQKKKKGIFRRTTSDSSVMAELLVRSVIHAQSSLDCISELNSDGGVQESQVCDVQSVVTSSSDSSGSDNEYDNLSDATENREDFDTVSDVVKNVELIERRLSSKNLRLFREIDEDRGEIYPNLVVPTEETEEISDQEQKTPPVAEEEDFSLVDSDEEKPEKFLIPPVLLGAEPNKSNLIETAIQTMLLEKVNILGSYSPPISPTQKETFGFQRVPTTLSLCESARDTVLGAPLVSPAMRKSEEQLANRSSSLERIKHNHKRRGSLTSLKSNRFTNFMSSLKGALKRDRSLLKAALKNVAMETVQDILATSHSNTNDPKSEPSRNQAVANTEIGTPSDNNVHASLTPDTRNSEAVRSLDQGEQRVDPVYLKFSRSPGILRRSSDSDLSVTPKGNSLTGSERSGHVPSSYCFRNNILLRSLPHKDNFDLLEYPFLSLSKCPPGFISYLGGTVCARSVKLLERITNPEEPETRDMWWSELRLEIRSHARTLNCNAVLGYCETTSICEDVCILSATGTAVIIRPNDDNFRKSQIIERNETEKDALDPPNPQESPEKDRSSSSPLPCTICHLPYNANAVPLRLTSSKCSSCRREKVPDILLATIELPDGVPLTGHGCLLQAHVCRMLRETRGESNAKEISDGLPFLEYELHRILVSKLKMRGMNAIFGLKVRITVGERMLVGLGTGTGVFLSALPPPSIPKLVSDHSDGKKVAEMQREIENVVRKNKEVYQITGVDLQNGSGDVDPRDVEVENSVFDYSSGNKDCCILEVDDPEDAEFLNLLMEHRPPDGFHAVTTQFLPGLEDADVVKNLQMFTQIWRSKVQPPIAVGKLFERLLQSVFFKLRRMVPCALCDLQFRLDLPEPDEIQLCVLGMALGLTELKKTVKKNDEELIFNYEEDQSPEASVIPMQRINKKRGSSYRDRHGVDITPLSFVPGAKIESYLGNLNFFLIRETQSIREEGGLSGFLHSFVTEALAIVRAHVTALGGNAMVAYFMTECVLNHNLHKNQGQCLINVGGDVVYVSYKEEKQ